MSNNNPVYREIGLCGNWTPFGPCQCQKPSTPAMDRAQSEKSVPATTALARAEDEFRRSP